MPAIPFRQHAAATITLAALLAACAHTPQEVVEMGERRTVRIALPADQSAACMQRNAENLRSDMIAERRGDRLIVRVTGGMPTTMAVVDFAPGVATVHIWRDFLPKDRLLKGLTDGC